ncbi:uncharacterized protein ASPGLDRAFT_869787 [Aspergillus glaucus CBS 516.65]|uniref:Uncharacterized protein n=1 Tax=Aspergillus glaucus CBS 516.65 TaxID=1160497 RepID=A0A1L9V902_ASPGL|nr:hypothetical protein ASPGLDRAFT_869787 [Aspergillus glaucus CBS 516.65]OJJ80390.1 hypothetical protein ASPGLDRAFT_869787 [Aspergillus glaucus CBS 516.65]
MVPFSQQEIYCLCRGGWKEATWQFKHSIHALVASEQQVCHFFQPSFALLLLFFNISITTVGISISIQVTQPAPRAPKRTTEKTGSNERQHTSSVVVSYILAGNTIHLRDAIERFFNHYTWPVSAITDPKDSGPH